MKLKEFFQGGDEVQDARKKRETLDKIRVKNGSLNNKQQGAFKQMSSLIRNHRLKVGLTLGGSSLIAAGGLYLLVEALPIEDNSYDNLKPVKAAVDKSEFNKSEILNGPNSDYYLIENNIERTDILIEKVESALLEFEKKIISKSANAPKYLKERLSEPFGLIRINIRTNPDRNHYRLLKRTEGMGNVKIAIPNQHVFTFRILSPALQLPSGEFDFFTLGAFEGISRSLYVRENFDTDNPLELLNIYHELVHALQDTQVRHQTGRDSWQKYRDLFGGHDGIVSRDVTIVDQEAQSIADEIDVMNILLDNKLRRSVDFGQELNIDEILMDFGLENKGFNLLKMQTYIDLIKAFYPHGMGPRKELSEKYLDEVRKLVSEKGGIIYETMPF